MRRLLAAVLLASLLLVPSPAQAHHRHRHPVVYMVGDSITVLGTDDLRALGAAHWQISAASGRYVDTLPDYLWARIQRRRFPDVVVIALGANASPGWRGVDFRNAIRLLPARTRIVLVTVYRDPAVPRPDDYRHDPAHSLAYTRDMQRIAATRPHTCLAPWRAWASQHRDQLFDGVHPHTAAQKVWAQTIYDAVRRCK